MEDGEKLAPVSGGSTAVLAVADGRDGHDPHTTSGSFNGGSSDSGSDSDRDTTAVANTQASSEHTPPQPEQRRDEQEREHEAGKASPPDGVRGGLQQALPVPHSPGGEGAARETSSRDQEGSRQGDVDSTATGGGEIICNSSDDDSIAEEGADGGRGEGEEKREIGWGPTSTNTFTPPTEETPEQAPGGPDHATFTPWSDLTPALAPAPSADASAKPSRQPVSRRSSSLSRYPSLPLLSAGPYLHKRGSSAGGSLVSSFKYEELEEEEQQEASLVSTPKTNRGRGNAAHSATPGSRPRTRKVAPMLGMLQSAQDLAGTSSVAVGNSNSPATTGGGGDGTSSRNSNSWGHKRASRSMSVGFGSLGFGGGGGGGASRAATPVTAAASVGAKKGLGRPILTPLSISRTAAFDQEEAFVVEEGGRGGGWGGVGSRDGRRRLRNKANSFIQRLPGPKLLMQGECGYTQCGVSAPGVR